MASPIHRPLQPPNQAAPAPAFPVYWRCGDSQDPCYGGNSLAVANGSQGRGLRRGGGAGQVLRAEMQRRSPSSPRSHCPEPMRSGRIAARRARPVYTHSPRRGLCPPRWAAALRTGNFLPRG
ncbi:Dipeptidase 2 [Manis pentadactyla]|nr:Dipeptidase 2 [Manis pentadactyla]